MRRIVALLLLASVVAGAFLALTVPASPFAGKVAVEAGIIRVTGSLTGDEFAALQAILHPPTTETVWHVARSSYPTLEWIGETRNIPRSAPERQALPIRWPSLGEIGASLAENVLKPVKSAILWVLFDSWVGTAAAATKTEVSCSPANWSNTACWSPSGVPVNGDTVVFNGSSTSITIDQTVPVSGVLTSLNTTGFTGTITDSTFAVNIQTVTLSSGTGLALGSGTWTITVPDNITAWTNASTSTAWNPGTGTVKFQSGTSSGSPVISNLSFAALPTSGSNPNGVEFNKVIFDYTGGGAASVAYTLVGSNGLTAQDALTIQRTGLSATVFLDTSSSNLPIRAASVNIATVSNARLTANASTITVTGTSGTVWTVTGIFTQGTSTVKFTGSGSVATGSQFATLQVSASGTIAFAALNVLATTLTVTAGALSQTTGTGTVTNVNVSGGAIQFGSGNWTVSGTWIDSASGSGWNGGTNTVTFTGAATHQFGGFAEFNNVAFSTATATMSARGLSWSGTLTVNSTLNAGGQSLTGGNLTVASGGTLNGAGASNGAVSVSTFSNSGTATLSGPVTTAGVTQGTLHFNGSSWTLTGLWGFTGNGTERFTSVTVTPSGSFTLSTATLFTGGFNSSAAGSTITLGSNAIDSNGGTLAIRSGQELVTLNVTGGTITLGSFLLATTLNVSAGTLAMAGFPVLVNGALSVTGTGSLNFGGSALIVTGNVSDTSSVANVAASGALILGSATTQNLQGGTWPNVALAGGSKGFTASLTTLNVSSNAALTVTVTAGITWTLVAGGTIQGVSNGARLTLTSGATWTLNTSGVTANAQFVAVDHSTASPAINCYTCVDNGVNVGWNFSPSGNFLGPLLVILQADPAISLSVSALAGIGLVARRVIRKKTKCPQCGHRFRCEHEEDQ